jgi:hypothetical protein
MIEVFGMFIWIAFFVAILMALQATFYWVWGTGWKSWWIGRAAYWIWGPIEEEHIYVDLEKGMKGTEGYQTASLPREVPKLVQPTPYPDTIPAKSSNPMRPPKSSSTKKPAETREPPRT